MGGAEREKWRSIGYLSRGRTRSRSKSGREHPDSGEPFKVTRDELGNDVTEHGKAGSGVSDRQDVNIHPEPVRFDMRVFRASDADPDEPSGNPRMT